MSEQARLNSIELEQIELELHALLELEQAALQHCLALPVGYEKSQTLAEYSNAMAARSAMRQRREHLLDDCQYHTDCADVLSAAIDQVVDSGGSK